MPRIFMIGVARIIFGKTLMMDIMATDVLLLNYANPMAMV